jgi:hypothetical protein
LTETAEHFTNGMGIDIAKERFTRVLESAHCKQQCHDSGGWSLLIELIVLAFLWQLPKIKVHYVGDLGVAVNDQNNVCTCNFGGNFFSRNVFSGPLY